MWFCVVRLFVGWLCWLVGLSVGLVLWLGWLLAPLCDCLLACLHVCLLGWLIGGLVRSFWYVGLRVCLLGLFRLYGLVAWLFIACVCLICWLIG